MLESGPGNSAEDEHLKACPACCARVDALAPTAGLTLNLAGVQHGGRLSTSMKMPPLRLPDADAPTFTQIKPSKGEIWLSAHEFSFPDVTYQDLDSVMVVVLDSNICEAGMQWVDVAPISGEPERASDLDVVFEREHTTLQMPLYAQPRRQLVMAFQQLQRKVGEVLEEAYHVLCAASEGRPVDESWLGTPYDGPYDPRIEADRYVEKVLERLREPYGPRRTYHATRGCTTPRSRRWSARPGCRASRPS
jgi:hypothetical protein